MLTGVSSARLHTQRSGPNLWWLWLTDPPTTAAEALSELPPTSMPSEAIPLLRQRSAAEPGSTALVAKLELDVCGAWLTVANSSTARPVVVRRAGWVDLRGHPATAVDDHAAGAPADDRVGLGPGDVLVLPLGSDSSAIDTLNDHVVDACLESAGRLPQAVADALRRRIGGQVAVVGVPGDLGTQPLDRVAMATGIPADEVQSPGYPLGDLQPDLWRQPPHPPRLARLRLSADRSSVGAVRSLLDRLLASWRLDERIDPDDVKLVATELAANAVVHSSAPGTVTVRYRSGVVRIEVTDQSPHQPVQRTATPDAEGGRGLQLIQAIGSAWGTDAVENGGKRVWCELEVSSGS